MSFHSASTVPARRARAGTALFRACFASLGIPGCLHRRRGPLSVTMGDPVGHFEHSHAALTKLVLEVGQMLRADIPAGLPADAHGEHLAEHLKRLRDELLEHFAQEEEGLFPFVRAHVPAKASAVDRLVEAHDMLCGTIVRLVHLVDGDGGTLAPEVSAYAGHYERFEAAYVRHSRDEAALLEHLGRALNETQRGSLAEILRGL